ncbi:hypothetical protein Bca4012_083690 [Brassica carinata]
MHNVVTGVPLSKPCDPSNSPDLTLSLIILSTSVCSVIFIYTCSDPDLKFKDCYLKFAAIFRKILLLKESGSMNLIVVIILFLTAVCRSFFIISYTFSSGSRTSDYFTSSFQSTSCCFQILPPHTAVYHRLMLPSLAV